MLYEIKHRFNGCVLFSLDCENMKICVKAAIEVKADLRGADLRGADLSWANLSWANLSWADLAILGNPDGWQAWTYLDKATKIQRVRVGCQDKTIAEGREYWANKKDRREVMAVLDYAEAIGKIKGWIKC